MDSPKPGRLARTQGLFSFEMPVFPGPAVLGRGVTVPGGRDVPAACRGWPRVVIDDDALQDPLRVAGILHQHWLRRRPCVVVLTAEAELLRAPERCDAQVWELDESFEFSRERLQYLAWSNNYDLRGAEPIWWHGRRAERLGATRSRSPHGDAVLPDGRMAWCDGGPREPLDIPGAVVVHRETLEAACLEPDRVARVPARLALDQLAAVEHGAGPARIIAPAGSGKTRVLTERLRHLLADRGVTPSTVTAVAFNKRAADELATRTEGLPTHLRTFNSLGLAIVNGTGPFATAGPARKVIEEVEVRRILESLVRVRRQQNTDPWAVYIEALSAIRLGLSDPSKAEAAFPDATGIAEIFPRYRSVLAERQLLDFDEQIYLAIEVLLGNPEVRRQDQNVTRHLLVDEFQDLAPAHLLMLRLLSAPTYDVFGVGDDDQVIYGYAGATPEYLIAYARYFPGAREYALETNYRCPPAVVDGARTLLSHNRRRVAKSIKAAARALGTSGGLLADVRPADEHAPATAEHIGRWLDTGAAGSDIAVLSRVNSALLPVQVTLMEHGIPCSAPLGSAILSRTGIRSALAYLRIGADPGRISRGDVAETVRRPSRRIARNVIELLQKRATTSLREIRRLAGSLSGADVDRLACFADDLEAVSRSVAVANTAATLKLIRVRIGLGSAMDVLDGSKGDVEGSTHLDDLVALEAVARLHPDPVTFEAWLTDVLGRPGVAGGVVLSTVHRVKGQEWPHVIVYGANAGLFPHRLSGDIEEERRVFHVAITRASSEVVVLADSGAPSPFCRELSTEATPAPTSQPLKGRERKRAGPSAGLSPGAVTTISALRSWRAETSRRDKVPAYVVLSDAHLEGIAVAMPSTLGELAACRGIGPGRLERYGDELLAVIGAAGAPPPPSGSPGSGTGRRDPIG